MDDYYTLLGVPSTADRDQIQRAYRDLARRWHPDRGGSHEMMVRLNEAYFVLADPARRQEYDRCRDAARSTGSGVDRWEQTTASKEARAEAEAYPKDWDQFEAWLHTVAADIRRAEYGESDNGWPTVKHSWTGWLSIGAGAVVGGLVGYPLLFLTFYVVIRATGLGDTMFPSSENFERIILIQRAIEGDGAERGSDQARWWGWLAAAIVPVLRFGAPVLLVLPPLLGAWGGRSFHAALQRSLNRSTTSSGRGGVRVTDAERGGTIVECSRCGQRLRLPSVDVEVDVICPKCRHRAPYTPTA